jgi:hypothetical protein
MATFERRRLSEVFHREVVLHERFGRRVSDESRNNDDCVDVYGFARGVAEERHRGCGAFHHLEPGGLQGSGNGSSVAF